MKKLVYRKEDWTGHGLVDVFLYSVTMEDDDNRLLFYELLNRAVPGGYAGTLMVSFRKEDSGKVDQVIKEYNDKVDHDIKFQFKFDGLING